MRAQQRDSNEPDIIAALEAIGASVEQLPGGNGRPDLLVGYRGVNHLLEVKDPNADSDKRRLNAWQKKWHAGWKGKCHLVETVDQAFLIVGASLRERQKQLLDEVAA